MMARSSVSSLVLFLAPLLLLPTWSSAWAEHHFFCQKTVFYKPTPPCIRYKCICPQRICPGCPLPNFGYYPTTWHPWPFPINSCYGPVSPAGRKDQSSSSAALTNSEQLSQPSKLPQEPTLP